MGVTINEQAQDIRSRRVAQIDPAMLSQWQNMRLCCDRDGRLRKIKSDRRLYIIPCRPCHLCPPLHTFKWLRTAACAMPILRGAEAESKSAKIKNQKSNIKRKISRVLSPFEVE